MRCRSQIRFASMSKSSREYISNMPKKWKRRQTVGGILEVSGGTGARRKGHRKRRKRKTEKYKGTERNTDRGKEKDTETENRGTTEGHDVFQKVPYKEDRAYFSRCQSVFINDCRRLFKRTVLPEQLPIFHGYSLPFREINSVSLVKTTFLIQSYSLQCNLSSVILGDRRQSVQSQVVSILGVNENDLDALPQLNFYKCVCLHLFMACDIDVSFSIFLGRGR